MQVYTVTLTHEQMQTQDRMVADNSNYKKLAVQCFNEALLCIKFSAGGQFIASKSASSPSAKLLPATSLTVLTLN